MAGPGAGCAIPGGQSPILTSAQRSSGGNNRSVPAIVAMEWRELQCATVERDSRPSSPWASTYADARPQTASNPSPEPKIRVSPLSYPPRKAWRSSVLLEI